VYAGIDPVTGKRRHLYGTASGPKKARALEGKLEREALKLTPAGATVGYLLDEWLQVARHSPANRYTTETRIAKWIRPTLGDEPIGKVTTQRLDRFYVDLEREGLAPGTVVRLHGILRAAFAQAVRWDWLDKNPAQGCSLPEVGNPTPVSPTGDIVRQLLDAAPADFAAFLRLVAVTGMRRGEACALRRSDLDLDAGVVRKARAISQGVERATKTGARYAIAIDPGTAEAVAQHVRDMDERAAEFDLHVAADAFVFSNEPDCAQPWRPDGVTQRLDRLCERIGVKVRLKDLRDFMVTSLLESGQSVRTVAGRAGHARASTTLTHYAAWVPASDRKAADQIGELLE
jgi:integrase